MNHLVPTCVVGLFATISPASEVAKRLPGDTPWKVGQFELGDRVFEYRERPIDVVLDCEQLSAREAIDCPTLLEIAAAFLYVWEISHDARAFSRLYLTDDQVQDPLAFAMQAMTGNGLREGRRYSRLVEYEGYYFLIGTRTPDNDMAIKQAVGVYQWDYGRWWAVLSTPNFEKVDGPLFRREIVKHSPPPDP